MSQKKYTDKLRPARRDDHGVSDLLRQVAQREGTSLNDDERHQVAEMLKRVERHRESKMKPMDRFKKRLADNIDAAAEKVEKTKEKKAAKDDESDDSDEYSDEDEEFVEDDVDNDDDNDTIGDDSTTKAAEKKRMNIFLEKFASMPSLSNPLVKATATTTEAKPDDSTKNLSDLKISSPAPKLESAKEALQKTNEKTLEALQKTNEKTKEALQRASESMQQTNEKTKEAIQKTNEKTKEALQRASLSVQQSNEKTKEAMKRASTELKQKNEKVKQDIKKIYQKSSKSGRELLRNLGQNWRNFENSLLGPEQAPVEAEVSDKEYKLDLKSIRLLKEIFPEESTENLIKMHFGHLRNVNSEEKKPSAAKR